MSTTRIEHDGYVISEERDGEKVLAVSALTTDGRVLADAHNCGDRWSLMVTSWADPDHIKAFFNKPDYPCMADLRAEAEARSFVDLLARMAVGAARTATYRLRYQDALESLRVARES